VFVDKLDSVEEAVTGSTTMSTSWTEIYNSQLNGLTISTLSSALELFSCTRDTGL